MNTYITLDYELFFGKSGTVEKSIQEPTQKLLDVLNKYNAKAVFFVDIGYLIRCKELEVIYPNLKKDVLKVKNQIKTLVEQGHDIQLHIHSHWEDAYIENGEWKFPMEHYRLHSFTEQECVSIFKKYKNYLEEISGQEVVAFRAGGWCIQPFNKLKHAFLESGITIDSTVFKNGKNVHGSHFYNFENTPDTTEWNFTDDPCVPEDNGKFKEIPISSYRVSLLFFWKLIFYKKFGGKAHQQIGDGYAVKNGLGQKLRLLFKNSNTVVSIDGYKTSYLQKAYNHYKHKFTEQDNFVIIGHPKAFSDYSLVTLDKFLSENITTLNIRTFRKYEE